MDLNKPAQAPKQAKIISKAAQSRSKKSSGLNSLERVLPDVLSNMGLEKRLKEHGFMQLWFSVCDSQLKERSRPLYMDHQKNLVIAVSDAAVAQEVSLMRNKLTSQLGQMARSLGIEFKGLRIDLKNFHEAQTIQIEPEAEQLPVPKAQELESIVLNDTDKALLINLSDEIDKSSSDTQNSLQSEIKKRVMQIFERQLRLRSWRREHDYPICQNCQLPSHRLHDLEYKKICFTCLLTKS